MFRAIIVDDDSDSSVMLQLMLKQSAHDVSVIAVCASADEAKAAIETNKPDVLFLDIEMPDKSGFDLLQELGTIDFDIIFTTAHQAHALRALRASALDFLLKPILQEDFQEALARLREKQQLHSNLNLQIRLLHEQLSNATREINKIAIPTLEGLEFVQVADIIRVEADRSYALLFLKDRTRVLVSKPLKYFEDLLKGSGFCRVHSSHLINLAYIKRYKKGDAGEAIMTDGSEVEISRGRKEEFLEALQEKIRGI